VCACVRTRGVAEWYKTWTRECCEVKSRTACSHRSRTGSLSCCNCCRYFFSTLMPPLRLIHLIIYSPFFNFLCDLNEPLIDIVSEFM